MLLFWSRDVARGRKIAAIRFETPVKIDVIRIVPAGMSPFQALPDELGSTDPPYFHLNAKLNYQPDDPNDKTRTANSLVSLPLQFDGTLKDFPVDMDYFSTRLVILEGQFSALSVAIYGRLASPLEIPTLTFRSNMPLDYEPAKLPSLPEPRLLPPALDPARMLAPTLVAVQLLSEDYPDWRFDSVIRQLMSEGDRNNGKIANGDTSLEWVSESLERCISDHTIDPEDWLDDAAHLSRSPFLAAVPELADRFVERLHDALGLETLKPTDFQRQCFFELLESMTTQPEYLVLNFLQPGILSKFMEGSVLEMVDLNHLHYAMFNSHIAQALREDSAALDHLSSIAESSRAPAGIKTAVRGIVSRANGWVLAESLMSHDTDGDDPSFDGKSFVSWFLDYLSASRSFAPMLLNLLHLASAAKNNVPIPSILLADATTPPRHLLNLLRAYQGVAAMIIVLCWALYDQNTALAYRTLIFLESWIQFDYTEAVGTLLRHPFVASFLSISTDASIAPPELVKLSNRVCQNTYSAIQTDDVGSAEEKQNINMISQLLEPSSTFVFTLDTLYTVRRAFAWYACSTDNNSAALARTGGIFGLAPSLASALVSIMRLTRSSRHDIETPTLPLLLLVETIVLGFVALQKAVSLGMLPRRHYPDVAQLCIEAFWLSHRLPAGLEDAANLLQSKAVLLLSSLCTLNHNNPAECAHILSVVISYPTKHRVVSLTEPALILNLLESLTASLPSLSGSWWAKRFVSVSRELDTLCAMLSSEHCLGILGFLEEIDSEHLGISLDLLALHCQRIEHAAHGISNDDVRDLLLQHIIKDNCDLLSSYVQTREKENDMFTRSDIVTPLSAAFGYLLSSGFYPVQLMKLLWALDASQVRLHPNLVCSTTALLLEQSHNTHTTVSTVYERCGVLRASMNQSPDIPLDVLAALGRSLSRIASDEAGLYQFDAKDGLQVAEASLSLLSWAAASSNNEAVALPSLSCARFDVLCDIFGVNLSAGMADEFAQLRNKLIFADDDEMGEVVASKATLPSDGTLLASYGQLQAALCASSANTPLPSLSRPSTPPSLNVGAVTALMSPLILRSPTITGPTLHKKYSAQDFRQARLSPTSASRPPSTHVDAFDNATLSPRVSPISPMLATGTISPTAGLQSPVMIYHPI